jgi:hypothetical protein
MHTELYARTNVKILDTVNDYFIPQQIIRTRTEIYALNISDMDASG